MDDAVEREGMSVEEGAVPRFSINAQTCVHGKTCDIKGPNQTSNGPPRKAAAGPTTGTRECLADV